MHYRRARVPGATYFFTVNLANRSSRLLMDKIDDLRKAVRKVHRAHPFQIVAWYVLLAGRGLQPRPKRFCLQASPVRWAKCPPRNWIWTRD
jgi:hypothetical protein